MDLLETYDVIIIGAGAAGLMAAFTAGGRGRRVLLIEHGSSPGKKIVISGGGHCNFTNLVVEPANYISQNPHFCKSALSRFGPYDFIAMLEKAGVRYHEKKLGQLFCRGSAREILNLLVEKCRLAKVTTLTTCSVQKIERGEYSSNQRYTLNTNLGKFSASSLVIASGGLSFPKIGASDFGYQVATQFALRLQPTQAALVSFNVDLSEMEAIRGLSGTSADALVSCRGQDFRESILFTHKGLSGPAILQISNYWHPGEQITMNLLPDIDLADTIRQWQQQRPKATLKTLIGGLLTKKLAERWIDLLCENKAVNQYHAKEISAIAAHFQQWRFIPSGTGGYRIAEVTRGGVDTTALSSKTFECKQVPGLYFIGEVLDVTGWLGGYNFQWAWSSGYCAGLYV